MASSPPEHHMDRLGHRLGDRFCNSALATEKRLEKSTPNDEKAFSFARDAYRLLQRTVVCRGQRSMSKKAGFASLVGGLMLVSAIFAGGGGSDAQQIGNAGQAR